ncbi:MAG: hypothetical protein RLZZ46_378 [Bacteroidota bacterium]
MFRGCLILLGLIFLGFDMIPGDPTLPEGVKDFPLIESLEDALKNPQEVYRLRLRREGLRKIPTAIWSFSNLVELDLSHNKIQYISDSISLLKNLKVLNLSFNKIKELPPQIGDLSNLQQMLIYHNRLQTVPAELGRLNKLTHLDLWYNEIITLPDSISRLTSLQEIDLRGMMMSSGIKEKVKRWFPQSRVYTAPDCNCSK